MSLWPRVAFNQPLVGLVITHNIFVVPKYMDGLHLILNLDWFNCHMHILTFKMPTIRQLQLLLKPGEYAFLLISRMLICIFSLFSIIITFYSFFGATYLISGKVLSIWLAMAPRVFSILTKPILFPCHCKGLCVIIYLDDILVPTHSKHPGKRAQTFLCSLLVHLGLHFNFSKSSLHLPQCFFFLGQFGNTVDMSVSLPSNKPHDIQWFDHALLCSQPVMWYVQNVWIWIKN